MNATEQAQRALTAAEADLLAAQQAEVALYDRGPADTAMGRLAPGPLKQHRRAMAGEMRAEKDAGLRVRRAESVVVTRKRQLATEIEKARPKLTVDDVRGAVAVRDRYRWHRVVKVNTKTVKVVVEPGMDDLISLDKVLEVRR